MIGQVISHYRILEKLGGGGMGIVFLAEDLKLGRRVALKFLSEAIKTNPAILERFTREARTASALNHPNICIIYEIDEVDGKPFIAMELLEGHSLDQELHGNSLPIDHILDLGIQLSDGLDAAHRKGIVHRDIKPANLFINSLGQLKILDFGLAKLASEENFNTLGSGETVGFTTAENLTSPGTAIGTVAYMSPEQARGDGIDARSDIFSAGSVLYELSSGRLPFPGKTSAVVFDAILNREPVPPLSINPSLPQELQRIIDKCLEKDRDVRYQSSAELRADLKRLKRDSASGRHPTKSSASLAIESQPEEASVRKRQTSSSVLVEAAKKHTVGVGVGTLITLLIPAAATFGIYALLHKPDHQAFQNFSVTSMTTTGDADTAAISPDGKYLAYLRREVDGNRGVWIRQLSTNSNSQIIPPSDAAYTELQFGPESNYIYYRVRATDKSFYDLYRVPFLGGTPERLARDVDSSPSFSPDGKRFIFLRENAPAAGQSQILAASTEGGQESVLTSGKVSDFTAAVWSPDGGKIAFGRQRPGEAQWDIKVLTLSGNDTRQLLALPEAIFEPNTLAWLPSGRGLLLVYRNIDSGKQQIAYIIYPQGEFRKVTNDISGYRGLSLTADGKGLVTTTYRGESVLHIFPTNGVIDDAHGLSAGSAFWVDWFDNRRIISFDQENGIYVVTPQPSSRSELFRSDHLTAYDGRNCAGQSIAFTGVDGRDPSSSHIYETDLNGANLRQLTSGKENQYFRCSRDGVWLIYFDFADASVKNILRSGGPPQILVPGSLRPDNQFDVARDGKSLIIQLHSAGESVLATVSIDTGEVSRKFPLRTDANYISSAPDGARIGYISREHGTANLWVQPLSGGSPTQLSKFVQGPGPGKSIRNFAWSPDGKQLALVRTAASFDVVLLRDRSH
jgi:eukaryotic-like serine/threonine-protein kinase